MASIGKINLEEDCPTHPFVSGSIQFVPKPVQQGSNELKNTKDNGDNGKYHTQSMQKRELLKKRGG